MKIIMWKLNRIQGKQEEKYYMKIIMWKLNRIQGKQEEKYYMKIINVDIEPDTHNRRII
ncbi:MULTISPECIES: hypothetical protein [unclassified Methanosarcina]|uniref:hypothetical protein n=1 Tax=unclassified Methanosarcina TaxID=2644672 RepID=UPI000ABB6EAD|nr:MULTISPECIES: hypothetical protein [unclassified Methanosarcina]